MAEMIAIRKESPELVLREADYILKLAVGLSNIGVSMSEDMCPICHENFASTLFFSPSGASYSIAKRNKLISCGCAGTGNKHIFHEMCLHLIEDNKCPVCRCDIKKGCIISEKTTNDTCDNKSKKSIASIHAEGKQILNANPETLNLLHNLERITEEAEENIRQRQEKEEVDVQKLRPFMNHLKQEVEMKREKEIERERVANEVIDELERNAPEVQPIPAEERQQGIIGWMSNYIPGPLTRRKPATSGIEQSFSSRTRPYGGKSKKNKKQKTKNKRKFNI